MKNLQNFGVQELSAKEIRETSGGFFPWIILGIVALATVIGQTIFSNSNKKCKASSNCSIGNGGGAAPSSFATML